MRNSRPRGSGSVAVCAVEIAMKTEASSFEPARLRSLRSSRRSRLSRAIGIDRLPESRERWWRASDDAGPIANRRFRARRVGTDGRPNPTLIRQPAVLLSSYELARDAVVASVTLAFSAATEDGSRRDAKAGSSPQADATAPISHAGSCSAIRKRQGGRLL